VIWSGFVANTPALWQAYNLSKTMRARPSDVYAISGAFRRFCFDQAVMTFGVSLEAELDSVKESKDPKQTAAKKSRIIDNWLGRPMKFREPMATTTSSPTAGSESSSATGGEGHG
jgi:hypothetical protein